MMAANEKEEEHEKPFFSELDPDDPGQRVREMESLCMNCHEQGTTRLMLTKIPHFKEVILSSFDCDHCGFENREVQLGGRIQDRGVQYTVTITTPEDLNRQVVKSDYATFTIPDVEFEQPPTSRKAEISTVEGLIDAVKGNLEKEQPLIQALDPTTADKLGDFIEKLVNLKTLEKPFKLVVDDPSGNSFVENPLAPLKDPHMVIHHYTRTKAQDIQIGILTEDDPSGAVDDRENEEAVVEPSSSNQNAASSSSADKDNLSEEVLMFRSNCPDCNAPCDTNMKLVNIPFFKEVLIMATVCDACGFRDNEVKSGSGIEPKGTRITLRLTDPSDLNRDVLKSDTCGLKIPALELEMEEGSLGGRFTTLEGLLTVIKDQLMQKNPFISGDSAQDGKRLKIAQFCNELDKVIRGEKLGIDVVLDDPAGNSYIQNLYAPDPDPEMKVEHYERSREQMDMLGLLHMSTENYANENS